jgi:hypothetical protein
MAISKTIKKMGSTKHPAVMLRNETSWLPSLRPFCSVKHLHPAVPAGWRRKKNEASYVTIIENSWRKHNAFYKPDTKLRTLRPWWKHGMILMRRMKTNRNGNMYDKEE